MRGGSAALLLDSVAPDLRELKAEDVDHGLAKSLQTYGVNIEPGLVFDTQCATINVSRQQGYMRIQQPVRYPLFTQPKSLAADHPLTRGLTEVIFPFMSPLSLAKGDGAGLKEDVLVESSSESWVQKPPYDLDPFHTWTKDQVGEQKAHPLVVAVEGKLASAFGQGPPVGEAKAARLVVAGGASFVRDDFFSEGNQALLLNMLDWLVRDDALLAVRTRGLKAAPLREVSDSSRLAIRYMNVLGVPLLCIAFGLVRWRRRESRRSKVSL
jgi:ABC-type uncharacterized transport system involved in gliding motility auxiliary subunit